jgi:diguanylate cyclase (GGDEF)-like protein
MAPTKAQSKSAPASPPGDSIDLRIVLVGRTGLDGRLRLDPRVELLRAANPLDAVGETAEAARHAGDGPVVVVVSAASDPGAPPAPGRAEDLGKRREFLAALRRSGPQVRILYLDDHGHAPDGYDGTLKPDAGADVIRAVLNGRAGNVPMPDGPAPDSAGASQPATNGAPAAAAQALPETPAVDVSLPVQPPAGSPAEDISRMMDMLAAGKAAANDTGDEVLVRLLLQGRDITDAALDLVRRRLGGRDVAFVMPGRTAAADGQATMHEASVAWRGRMLGRLRSPNVTPEELAPHASWLAAWLVIRDQHAQLREAAFADPLTGAHNRRYFDQFLRMAMDEARKERRGVTLLIFDIDDFKQFNDRYGHAAGDEILRETVRLLRSVIRPSDKVCRIGGDEFAVVFHEPTGPRTPSSRPPSDVCEIAERFQREIRGHRFPKLGREAPGPLTISGGLATYPWDGATAESLLARADELAMQSKRAGKNCITFGPGAEDVPRGKGG